MREATADFADVWINIAHIYVEQKQYVNAIQMYENCLKRFFKHTNTDTLLYMASAYYKWGKLRECKNVLLKARRVSPHDTVLLYNLALVLQKLATSVLEDSKSSLQTVLSAVNELGFAQKYFNYLKTHGDKQKFDLAAAAHEEKSCQDLLSQAQYHVARARRLDEEEQEIRRKQEEEREALRRKAEEEQRAREEEKYNLEQQKIAKREQYKAESKSILDKIEEPVEEKSGGRKGRPRKPADEDDWVSDGSYSAEEVLDAEGKPIKRKREEVESGGKRRKRVRRRERGDSSGDEENREVSREERRKSRKERRDRRKASSKRKGGKDDGKPKQKVPSQPATKKGNFLSKEFVSASDTSSSDDEEGPTGPKLVINESDDDSDEREERKERKGNDSNDDSDASEQSGRERRERRKQIDSDDSNESGSGSDRKKSSKSSADSNSDSDDAARMSPFRQREIIESDDDEVKKSEVEDNDEADEKSDSENHHQREDEERE